MRRFLLALLCAAAAGAQAQQAGDAAEAGAEDARWATDFDTIRVIERRPEPVDPFGFRSDFDPDRNSFNRHWREPPSVEDVSLQGGYLLLGINYGLMKVAEQVTRLPGWRHQVRPATARPPPLDEAQQARAARLLEDENP